MAIEQITQASFYLDWKFWSVVVSTIAIVLSQLPPLHILLRSAKLDVEAYSRMHLTHKLSNPNAQLHLIVSNTGGREVKIKKITLQIRRGTEDSFVLPAQNYLQLPGDKEAVLLTTFKIKPNDEWAHIVNFLNYFSRSDEKTCRQLEFNLRQDIHKKRDVLEDKNIDVAGDDGNVQPLWKFFETKFRWFPGEYSVTLKVEAEPKKASVTKDYRFTLFESDSSELQGYRDDYKYGYGVFLIHPHHQGAIVPLSEA